MNKKIKVKNASLERLTRGNSGRIFNHCEFSDQIKDGVYVISTICPEDVKFTVNRKKVPIKWDTFPGDADGFYFYFRLVGGHVQPMTWFDICMWAEHGENYVPPPR